MKISIIGASGYSGAELLNLLLGRRGIEIEKVFANSSAGKKVEEVYPFFRSRTDLTYEEYSAEKIRTSDVVFIALPSGEAMHIVPELLKTGKRVIDLGGDFRLKDASLYSRFYKRAHAAADILPKAVYGLPEWNTSAIASAHLLSNPGCYATSAILALVPVLKDNLIEATGIAVSSLSGVSGAGKNATLDYSFTELNESVRAYKVAVHQHTPEMKSVLENISRQNVSLTFVPHLIPITRGIYTTIYARPKKAFTKDEIIASFKKHYSNAPFVRFIGEAVPEIKHVNYTNFCDIGFKIDLENNLLIIMSVIDNLVKGAAGQAIQNMNIMFGMNETEGLL
ncbi:MAG: N-acetyl-gamma-glutamyl-phosphate reductase [Bacteroidota bacterium]|nr:N-acetyl-gamma-glutamyl-phosphate reductase [Bacteroidota bacterium]